MKLIYKIQQKKAGILWIGLLSVLFFTACNDFLHITSDTQKQASESFRTIEDLRDATAALYTAPWFEFNGSSFRLFDSSANNIDADGTSSAFLTFAMFAATGATEGLSNVWNSLYNVITQSDYIINNYVPVGREYIEDEGKVNACEGEARFMRGTAYWHLAMGWHDVPIIDDPNEYVLTPLTAPNPFEDVIQYAIYDLEYAAEWLPASDDLGRVTRYSAEAMLARLYLTAANFAMGNHFSQDYLNRNEAGSNAELAEKYLAGVKELTESVISKGTQYGIMEDYEDLFKVQHNNNKETLFGIQFVPGSIVEGLGNSRQNNLAGDNNLTGGLNAWGGSVYGSYDLVHLYHLDGGKARMRGNIFVAGETYDYLATHTDAGFYTVLKEKCNIKKFVVGSNEDSGGVALNGNTGLVTPIIRLAEVYLMYAEACIGTGDQTIDPVALERFNAIRERAFYLNPDDFVPHTTVTRTDIFKERRMEFFMELLFWPDILRRSFYDMEWTLKYLNNKLVEEDPDTELTNWIWYAYTYNPSNSNYAANGGWNNSPRSSGIVPQTAVHTIGSSYAHAPGVNTIWAFPYPETDSDKNPLLNNEPEKYNFSK